MLLFVKTELAVYCKLLSCVECNMSCAGVVVFMASRLTMSMKREVMWLCVCVCVCA